jgi:hypothetical protein
MVNDSGAEAPESLLGFCSLRTDPDPDHTDNYD